MNNNTKLDAGPENLRLSPGDVGISGAGVRDSFGASELDALLGTVYFWAGIIAVIIIIIGGIRYVTSNGDPGATKSAKNTILYAVIGLIVIIMASAITGFVIQEVNK